MSVLLTGGSGYIGSAVAAALLKGGHDVVALTRSETSERKLVEVGCQVVRGNICAPDTWMPALDALDGIIHLAATFGPDMASADGAFVDVLLARGQRWADAGGREVPVIYTGGTWLYGPVGDNTAVEGSPFNPPADFAFMTKHRLRLFAASGLATRVVHPAMVWNQTGGVIGGFIAQANRGEAIRVTGDLSVRWPLVHRDDLASLYVLALERGERLADYHGVAEQGVRVGAVASAVAAKYGAPKPVVQSVDDAVEELGPWAACRAFDQTMDAPSTRSTLGWAPMRSDILSAL